MEVSGTIDPREHCPANERNGDPHMNALLIGSISTLVDTSELQRAAFNEAFREAGLDWKWSRDEYRAMLDHEGGRARIAAYAEMRDENVDATALHERKSALFQQRLDRGGLGARPGVADTLQAARDHGWRTGFVTTTTPENVASVLRAVSSDLDASFFDLVMDSTRTSERKPSPEPYRVAMRELEVEAGHCVAVEDNPDGVRSALAAGITTIAFPNENTQGGDFAGAAFIETGTLDQDRVLSLPETARNEGRAA